MTCLACSCSAYDHNALEFGGGCGCCGDCPGFDDGADRLLVDD